MAAGQRGAPPASVLILSGDVHHSYVAPLRYPDLGADASPVVQIVSSPLRNAVPAKVQRGFRFAASGTASLLGRVLAGSARLPPAPVSWRLRTGPFTGNGVGVLRLTGRSAELRLYRSRLDGDDARLAEVHRERLDLPG